jgi:acetate kinase
VPAPVAEKIAWLGAELDPAANAECETLIAPPGSRVGLNVVATTES